ncbi:MAG: TonB-dependent receptor [Gammaproteobacteria bacterium]
MSITILSAAVAAAVAASTVVDDLGDLSLEQLTQIQVVTPSKRFEALFDTPASVHVITAADIRRAGVRSIPDALRLAPGVEVARDGHDSWSISIRGFNNDLANKLLVLIDGRSVYSPLYAGVFWDVQNVMIEDIDRIEVINGPGGTMWGANAVNGVINIITRPATETTGGLVSLSGDDPWNVAALRYGHSFGNGAASRVYVRYFERDARQHGQGGFRIDAASDASRHTFQGDVYRGSTQGIFRDDEFALGEMPGESPGSIELGGHNLLYRWTLDQGDGASLRVRAFYDHTRREIPGTFAERRDTFDLDVQGALTPRGRHLFQWGAGARLTRDDIDNTSFAAFDPASRSALTLNVYAQNTITVRPESVFLTVGTKLERNDYTDFEWQPQARLAWHQSERSMAWFAVSQAVRVPARLETDITVTAPVPVPDAPFPFYVRVVGDRSIAAEELTAFEAGYRFRVGASWTLDASLFRHEYDNLIVTAATDPIVVTDQPGSPYLIIPATLANGMQGSGQGGTLAANWSPTPAWRVQFHYAHIDLDLENRPGFDTGGPDVARNSPRNQYALRVFADLRNNVSVYAGWRHVDALPNAGSPGYDTGNFSVRWMPRDRLELALTAHNLGGDHVEFGGYEVEPTVTGTLVWRF